MFSLAGLAAFAAVLSGKNRELDRQRHQAVNDRDRAISAEQAARDEEIKTKRSEAETKAVLDSSRTRYWRRRRPKDQEGGLGIEATIHAAVDTAEPGIEKAFADQPRWKRRSGKRWLRAIVTSVSRLCRSARANVHGIAAAGPRPGSPTHAQVHEQPRPCLRSRRSTGASFPSRNRR